MTVQELVAERVAEQLKKHEESLKEWLTEQQRQQQEFQRVLLQKIDERDQNLMTMIRETQETKKLIAATQQKSGGSKNEAHRNVICVPHPYPDSSITLF